MKFSPFPRPLQAPSVHAIVHSTAVSHVEDLLAPFLTVLLSFVDHAVFPKLFRYISGAILKDLPPYFDGPSLKVSHHFPV
jgi:hypothetical protein